MTIPRLTLLPLAVTLCYLSACVHYGQFRDDRPGDLSHKSIWRPEGKAKFYLAFIEVDEFGELFDRGQLNHAKSLIQEAKHASPTRNAKVITFIHGWKNNASDKSGNVWGFRDVLNDIACPDDNGTADTACPRRDDKGNLVDEPVVGIYIGWRGAVTNLPVVKELTFYNRRNAAFRIPGAHLTEILNEIMLETKSCIDDCAGDPAPGTQSLCVIVGHSFGGMVLERSLTQALVGDVLLQEAQRKERQHRQAGKNRGKDSENAQTSDDEDPGVKARADLVVLVNEAAPGTEGRQLLELLKKHRIKVTVEGRDVPLVLSVTSVGDAATGIALPLAQSPSKLTKHFRTYKSTDTDPEPISGQSTYYLHTMGHMPPMFSHVIKPRDDKSVQDGLAAMDRQKQRDSCYRSQVLKRDYCVVPQQGAYNNTPYWIMQMPKEIVPDHSTIFRPVFRELLTHFVAERIDVTQPGRPMKPAYLKAKTK